MKLSDAQINARIAEEPCRIGWPKLLPLPTKFKSFKDGEKPELTSLQAEVVTRGVDDMIRRHLTGSAPFEIGMQSTRNNKNIEKVATLRIKTFDRVNENAGWRNLLVDLVRELQLNNDDPKAHIEISEEEYPRMHRVELGNPVIRAWEESIKTAVLRVLRDSQMSWQTLHLVRLGSLLPSDRQVTALIEVLYVDDARWKNAVAPRIEEVMRRSGHVIKLAIWQLRDPVW